MNLDTGELEWYTFGIIINNIDCLLVDSNGVHNLMLHFLICLEHLIIFLPPPLCNLMDGMELN